MKETNIYPLRLPRSLKLAVERLIRQEGTGIISSVATAVAEKIAGLERRDFLMIERTLRISRPSPV
jgi:hypothetical protein